VVLTDEQAHPGTAPGLDEGELFYFLVYWCRSGRDHLQNAMGPTLLSDMTALLVENGIDPDRCSLERVDDIEDLPVMDDPPDDLWHFWRED
jgi:hypothetical protein